MTSVRMMVDSGSNFYTTAIWLTVILSVVGLVTGDGCGNETVFQALEDCRTERIQLSNAGNNSPTQDYTVLCSALMDYINCMEPRIKYCDARATSAFTIIKSTYSSEYHCNTAGTKDTDTSGSSAIYINIGFILSVLCSLLILMKCL